MFCFNGSVGVGDLGLNLYNPKVTMDIVFKPESDMDENYKNMVSFISKNEKYADGIYTTNDRVE